MEVENRGLQHIDYFTDFLGLPIAGYPEADARVYYNLIFRVLSLYCRDRKAWERTGKTCNSGPESNPGRWTLMVPALRSEPPGLPLLLGF